MRVGIRSGPRNLIAWLSVSLRITLLQHQDRSVKMATTRNLELLEWFEAHSEDWS